MRTQSTTYLTQLFQVTGFDSPMEKKKKKKSSGGVRDEKKTTRTKGWMPNHSFTKSGFSTNEVSLVFLKENRKIEKEEQKFFRRITNLEQDNKKMLLLWQRQRLK